MREMVLRSWLSFALQWAKSRFMTNLFVIFMVILKRQIRFDFWKIRRVTWKLRRFKKKEAIWHRQWNPRRKTVSQHTAVFCISTSGRSIITIDGGQRFLLDQYGDNSLKIIPVLDKVSKSKETQDRLKEKLYSATNETKKGPRRLI